MQNDNTNISDPKKTVKDLLKKHNCAVIIPTYNNDKTLKRVIEGVLEYTEDVIIVNDGSTDNSAAILESYSKLEIISYENNKGKGMALRLGFKKAINLGFDFVITIDSDGQHYPEDLLVFALELDKSEGDVLLIGSRNMTQSTVPKKSSFGNKFSNFWYRVETGIKLTDTQSGYRLYPLKVIKELRFFTTKFEFEIESIVKVAWRRIPVRNVPVKVLYDPDERVSHFRPFQDFTRISFLNTYLVLITFLWIKPRDFFYAFRTKGIRTFIKENIIQNNTSVSRQSSSIAFGLLVGLSPLWGFHTLIAITGAKALRLNAFVTFTFSNVSIPPMIPFIVLGSLKIGGFITGKDVNISFESLSDFSNWAFSFKEYLIGSIVLAILASILAWLISYTLISIIRKIRSDV